LVLNVAITELISVEAEAAKLPLCAAVVPIFL